MLRRALSTGIERECHTWCGGCCTLEAEHSYWAPRSHVAFPGGDLDPSLLNCRGRGGSRAVASSMTLAYDGTYRGVLRVCVPSEHLASASRAPKQSASGSSGKQELIYDHAVVAHNPPTSGTYFFPCIIRVDQTTSTARTPPIHTLVFSDHVD
jgi:hypothetical protein